MVKTIRSLWSGALPLPVAFWTFAVVWGLIVNIVTSMTTVITVLADAPVWLLIPVHLLPTPYNVLVIVGVWRSAEHYDGPRSHANLARIVTLIGMIFLSAT